MCPCVLYLLFNNYVNYLVRYRHCKHCLSHLKDWWLPMDQYKTFIIMSRFPFESTLVNLSTSSQTKCPILAYSNLPLGGFHCDWNATSRIAWFTVLGVMVEISLRKKSDPHKVLTGGLRIIRSPVSSIAPRHLYKFTEYIELDISNNQ
jgi:hypothetical protein